MPLYRAEVRRRKGVLPPVLIHDLSQVGYWPFDHDDGDYARDRSGHANHGTIYGATRVAGRVAGALSFDGENDYVNVPYSASLDAFSALTVACWIYPTAYGYPDYYRHIIDKGWRWNGAFVLYLDKTVAEKLVFTAQNDVGEKGEAYSTAITALETWYHVAGVWDGSTISVYVNGVKGVDNSLTGTLTFNSWTRIAGAINGFKGIIDEVRVFNRALSAGEIRRLMNMRGI